VIITTGLPFEADELGRASGCDPCEELEDGRLISFCGTGSGFGGSGGGVTGKLNLLNKPKEGFGPG
jgi:hypothetical protein